MSFLTQNTKGLVYLTSDFFDNKAVTHGFSSRLGGVSQGVVGSLNLRTGGPALDSIENIKENYRRLCAALGADYRGIVRSNQVHGDRVRCVTKLDCGLRNPLPYEADALITNEPGLSLMVFSADCILLLLHDPVNGAIGAIHAGWRGTALDICRKTVEEMTLRFGTNPKNLRVAIGPGIGSCCFETDRDVPNAMHEAFGRGVDPFLWAKGDKWQVDLKAINGWRLYEAGVDPDRIDLCPLCTACNPDLFWSHRKCGNQRGLQCGLISLKPGGEV